MKNSLNSIKTTIKLMENSLAEKCTGIRVALADKNIPGMIIPGDDSDYVHVYLLNVPGELMLSIEDAAYDIWKTNRTESVCFFQYSPDETKKQFPAYAITPERSYVSTDAISSLENKEWDTSEKQVEPTADLWNLVNQIQKLSNTSLRGRITAEEKGYIPPLMPSVNNVAADTRLAKAA